MECHKSFLDHKVTKSSPSPALCCVEPVAQDEQNSHITAFNSGDGSTNSDNESSSSKAVRDVHIVRTTIAHLNTTQQIKIVYFSVLCYVALTIQIEGASDTGTCDYIKLKHFLKLLLVSMYQCRVRCL